MLAGARRSPGPPAGVPILDFSDPDVAIGVEDDAGVNRVVTRARRSELFGTELWPFRPVFEQRFVKKLSGEHIKSASGLGVPLVEIGLIYAWLPDLDKAFEFMNRALEERPTALMYLTSDPGAAPLHEDPRCGQLEQQFRQPVDSW